MNTILRELRKQHDYTQETLAEMVQVSRQTISNWETGKSSPDIQSIKRLADIYGSQVLSIFEIAEEETTLPKKEESPSDNRTTHFFVAFLNFLSLFIPLAAILSLFIVIQWRRQLPRFLFKFSFCWLSLISFLNVAVLLMVIIYFST